MGREYGITREEQDAFALESHRRAVAARDEGRFKDEIVPVEVPQRRGDPIVVDQDEPPRPDTTLEKLAKLRPAFVEDGTVTAGNSSGLNDGASAVLHRVRECVERNGWEPLARIVTSAVAGVEPQRMGIGPVYATRKALGACRARRRGHRSGRAERGIRRSVAGLYQGTRTRPREANVNGGAIALGHPLGCSGARILTTLVHEMERRESRYGLATMCIGVGQGIATIVERV